MRFGETNAPHKNANVSCRVSKISGPLRWPAAQTAVKVVLINYVNTNIRQTHKYNYSVLFNKRLMMLITHEEETYTSHYRCGLNNQFFVQLLLYYFVNCVCFYSFHRL